MHYSIILASFAAVAIASPMEMNDMHKMKDMHKMNSMNKMNNMNNMKDDAAKMMGTQSLLPISLSCELTHQQPRRT